MKSKEQEAYEKILETFNRESCPLSQSGYLWLLKELLAHLESCQDCVKEEMLGAEE